MWYGSSYLRLCMSSDVERSKKPSMDSRDIKEVGHFRSRIVEMPAPTAWPIVLAFGITLLFSGLVTNLSVSLLGAILSLVGSVGWFRDVLPHDKHESMRVVDMALPVTTNSPEVAHVVWMNRELHRARLPLEIYPIAAGVKGGLAGGAAMAVLAAGYGLISGKGFWYPINLLAAGFFPARQTVEQIAAFHWNSLVIASLVHLATSLLVGLLYGATLPMFPRRPILLGGIIAPITWSGLFHSMLVLFNPTLSGRIDWFWFAVSQVGFGIVAGSVVSKQERIPTWQHLPIGIRAGMEVSGGGTREGGEDPSDEA